MRRAFAMVLGILGVLLCIPGTASALDLTQRQVQVSGKVDVSAAGKLAEKMLAFDGQGTAPIYMLVSATSGTAQGVLLVADTVRSLESPVVAVVTTHVRGAGAAVVTFADQVLLYPSAGLVFTEVPYEGVEKYEPPKKKPKKTKKPKKDEKDEKDEKGEEGAEADGEKEGGDKASTKEDAASEEPEEEEAKDERKPAEKFLQDRVREDYLKAFYGRLAKRLPWKAAQLQDLLEKEGGVVVDADEAVRKKIAHGKVERITYRKLPEVKTEVKKVTTEKTEKTAPRP